MSLFFKLAVYLLLLLLACIIYLRWFKQMSLPLRIMTVLLLCTLINELIAAWMSRYYHNNMAVYHVYSPVSLAIVALYYNYLLPGFRKYRVGYMVAAFGIAAAVSNTIWLQPLTALDSHMVLLSGLCIISMALYALFYILTRDYTPVRRNIHFWLSLIFLVYWCATFLFWTFLQVFLITGDREGQSAVYSLLWWANCVTYAAIGILPVILHTQISRYDE